MSIHQALEQLRPCTCAIGYLTKSPEESVGDLHSPSFRILGSGFLVSAGVVVTNRHVVLALEAKIKELRLPANRCIAQFAYGSQQVFKFLTGHGFLTNKLDKARSDIGYVSFSTQDDASHPFIKPAKTGGELIVDVGNPVGVYGYPYGEILHKRESGEKEIVYRFGPLLQQGFISGMAPFDSSEMIERLLLDVRTAKGMSGCPVFDARDGTVIGIHSSGIGADVAFAIPIDTRLVDTIINIASGRGGATGTINQHSVRRRSSL